MEQRTLRHRQAPNRRRVLGWSLLLLSLLMILGATVYASRGEQAPVLKVGRTPTTQAKQAPQASPSPTVTCKTPPHQPGESKVIIHSSGVRRMFLLHLPPSYGTQPQPLVISFHGYTFTAQRMAQYTQMAAEADKAGFMVAYAQGLDDPPSWNAGFGTGDANDVQFTRDLVSYMEKHYCTDAHRVYVTGFSLGGGMAYRIACTLTNEIAAIATVAGAYYQMPGGCHPSRPIAVLEIHGQADHDAPYNGNPGPGMAAVQTYLNGWLTRDGCKSMSQVFFRSGDVTGIEWTQCAGGSEVVHYRVSNGGHSWPGAATKFGGFTTQVIDANVVIWDFFSRFSV